MKDRAYAKINLCLDVAGRREDGYHDLKMIMVPVDFYDILEIVPSPEPQMVMNRSYLPVNEKNTVVKAIACMKEKYGITDNFRCKLTKHIPTRAGLAGGSADAAAAIRILNAMYGLRMSSQEMIDVGRAVGADVPFCLFNKPAYVEGIGEKLTPFTCHPDFSVLLVKPRRGVSTKEAFEIVDSMDSVHPDCMAMMRGLVENDYDLIVKSLGNSLEEAAIQLVSEIAHVHKSLEEKGFDGVLMSGSGSTVFGITKNDALLEKAMRDMKAEGYFVRKTRVIGGNV